MVAEEIINEMIPPLKLSDTGGKAKHWMEELRLAQLPVVDKGMFLGLLSEDILLESNTLDLPISSYKLEHLTDYVAADTHFFDVLKLANNKKMTIVPVLNDNLYQGVVAVNEIATSIAEMFASQEKGGIMMISLNYKDYSLAEIARLVESNDVKILSSFIETDKKDPYRAHVTLKLNSSELTRVVATLERYGYVITKQFSEVEQFSQDQERLDLLMKYLSI